MQGRESGTRQAKKQICLFLYQPLKVLEGTNPQVAQEIEG
jgi:hypothetical protein